MWLTYTKAKIDEYEAQRSRFQDDEDKTDECKWLANLFANNVLLSVLQRT